MSLLRLRSYNDFKLRSADDWRASNDSTVNSEFGRAWNDAAVVRFSIQRYFSICLGKVTKNLRWGARSLGRDLTPGPPEHERGAGRKHL